LQEHASTCCSSSHSFLSQQRQLWGLHGTSKHGVPYCLCMPCPAAEQRCTRQTQPFRVGNPGQYILNWHRKEQQSLAFLVDWWQLVLLVKTFTSVIVTVLLRASAVPLSCRLLPPQRVPNRQSVPQHTQPAAGERSTLCCQQCRSRRPHIPVVSSCFSQHTCPGPARLQSNLLLGTVALEHAQPNPNMSPMLAESVDRA
jgi:hypothetical protein